MKTIEQTKREYADSIVPLDGHDKYSAPFITAFERHEDIEDAFTAGVEFAQRWYSVDEELPETNDSVLMKTKEDGVVFGKYKNIAIIWSVTHWRKIELT